MSRRHELPAADIRRQFEAMGPAWRNSFLYPRIRRTDRSQAYLDKWAVEEAARRADSARR